MYQFFADPGNIGEQDIFIEGKDYNHIRNVLRMKPGDMVSVSDGESRREYRCHIEGFAEDRVRLKLDFIKEADVELPVKVTLFQGLPKAGKMDYIIEKCTELGVFSIVPVQTERSVSVIIGEKAEKKTQHWQGKAEAAAKQSKRSIIPEIRTPLSFKEAVEAASGFEHKLIPYELSKGFDKTRELFSGIERGTNVAVFIGPEGGFSEGEIDLAVKNGFTPLSLGKRILRTETAALVVLSWLIYLFEEF